VKKGERTTDNPVKNLKYSVVCIGVKCGRKVYSFVEDWKLSRRGIQDVYPARTPLLTITESDTTKQPLKGVGIPSIQIENISE